MMTHRATLLAIGLVAVSCGDSLDVKTTAPRGNIGGVIVDAVTRAPLEGASVTVIAGSVTKGPEVTDATGAFSFSKIPAGEVLVMIDPPQDTGYRGTWLRRTLDDSAGEFPAQDAVTIGPIGLLAGTDEFVVRVLDLEGRPVSMYPVTLQHFVEYLDFSTGVGSNRGEVLVSATTGTDGRATFQGLPPFFSLSPDINATGVLALPPLENNGIFDYPGGTQTVDLRKLGDPTPDVILDPELATSLEIRASTIASLYNTGGTNPIATVLPINDVVHVAFNLPIQNNATVVVSDEAGTPISNQPNISISDDNLTMAFGNNPLVPGNEYNVFIHAVAAVGESNVSGDFTGAFFTPGLNDQVQVTNVTRDDVPVAQTVHLEFSEPIGYGTTGIITLNAGDCPLFIAFDLDGAGGVGNAVNERGNDSCNLALVAEEPDPPGIPTRSGYTKFWRFTAPLQSDATTPLPAGTRFDVVFSKVVTATKLIERPDGRPVRDFTMPNDIPIP